MREESVQELRGERNAAGAACEDRRPRPGTFARGRFGSLGEELFAHTAEPGSEPEPGPAPGHAPPAPPKLPSPAEASQMRLTELLQEIAAEKRERQAERERPPQGGGARPPPRETAPPDVFAEYRAPPVDRLQPPVAPVEHAPAPPVRDIPELPPLPEPTVRNVPLPPAEPVARQAGPPSPPATAVRRRRDYAALAAAVLVALGLGMAVGPQVQDALGFTTAGDAGAAAEQARRTSLRAEIAALEEERRSAQATALQMLQETNRLARQLIEMRTVGAQSAAAANPPRPAPAAAPAATTQPRPEDPLVQRILEVYAEAAAVKSQIDALKNQDTTP